jgi:hypothetical protein
LIRVETGPHGNQVYADCIDLSAVESAPTQKIRASVLIQSEPKLQDRSGVVQFGIFIYDGVEPIDLATFGVLSMARRVAPEIAVCTIAPPVRVRSRSRMG